MKYSETGEVEEGVDDRRWKDRKPGERRPPPWDADVELPPHVDRSDSGPSAPPPPSGLRSDPVPQGLWGSGLKPTSEVEGLIDAAYSEAAKWRKNAMEIPNGAVGESFIREVTRLISEFAEQRDEARFAFKALPTFLSLIHI